MQHLYGPKYHIERHVLFYALDGDHAVFLEILGHALAGSWHSLGGFNAWWAGGRGNKGFDDLRCQKQMEGHLKMVKDSGHIKQNLDQSLDRLKKTDAVYNVNLDDVVKDMEEEQQAFLKRAEDLQTYAESIRLAIHAQEIEDVITVFDLADEIERCLCPLHLSDPGLRSHHTSDNHDFATQSIGANVTPRLTATGVMNTICYKKARKQNGKNETFDQY